MADKLIDIKAESLTASIKETELDTDGVSINIYATKVSSPTFNAEVKQDNLVIAEVKQDNLAIAEVKQDNLVIASTYTDKSFISDGLFTTKNELLNNTTLLAISLDTLQQELFQVNEYIIYEFNAIRTPVDSLSILEGIKFEADYNRNFNEICNYSDTAILTVDKIQYELISTEELISIVSELNRTITEFIDVTDDFYGLANIDDDQYVEVQKLEQESLSINEYFFTEVFLNRSITEINSILDQASYTINPNKFDNINYLDTVNFSIDPTQLETITNIENISLLSEFNRSIVETNTLAIETIDIDISSNYTDILNIGDDIVINIDFARYFDEYLYPTDDYNTDLGIDDDQYVTFNKLLLDNTNIDEQIVLTSFYYRDLVENQLYNETIELLYETPVVETTTIAEYLEFSADNLLLDITNYNDTIDLTSEFNREIFESTNNIEIIDLTVQSIYLDTITVIDEIAIIFNSEFNEADIVIVTDDYYGIANVDDDQYVEVQKVELEYLNTNDLVIFTNEFNRDLEETLLNLETLELVNELSKLDSITNLDSIYSIIGINLFETATSSEIKTANIQDYVAYDYVEPGYIGTNLIL